MRRNIFSPVCYGFSPLFWGLALVFHLQKKKDFLSFPPKKKKRRKLRCTDVISPEETHFSWNISLLFFHWKKENGRYQNRPRFFFHVEQSEITSFVSFPEKLQRNIKNSTDFISLFPDPFSNVPALMARETISGHRNRTVSFYSMVPAN